MYLLARGSNKQIKTPLSLVTYKEEFWVQDLLELET
jgi:hypothetical protein